MKFSAVFQAKFSLAALSIALLAPAAASAACHGGHNQTEAMLGVGIDENAIPRTNYTFCVDIGVSPDLQSRIAQGDGLGNMYKKSAGSIIKEAYEVADRFYAVNPASSSGLIGIRFIVVNPMAQPPDNQTTTESPVVGVDCPGQTSGGTGQNAVRYQCVQVSADATGSDIQSYLSLQSSLVQKRSWVGYHTGWGTGLPVYLTDGATKGLLPSDLTTNDEGQVTAGSASH